MTTEAPHPVSPSWTQRQVGTIKRRALAIGHFVEHLRGTPEDKAKAIFERLKTDQGETMAYVLRFSGKETLHHLVKLIAASDDPTIQKILPLFKQAIKTATTKSTRKILEEEFQRPIPDPESEVSPEDVQFLARVQIRDESRVHEAIDCLFKLASKGNSEAQFQLRLLYKSGFGERIPKSDTEAFKLFKAAAEKGHASAENEVSFDPLRTLNIPYKKFGITGDTLHPQNVPKNFQTMVEDMRACGRRRDTSPEDEKEKLQHEARFLGITEAEYKAILLASGKEDPGGWKEEIENEEKIRDLLQQLETSDDVGKVEELLKLLQNHPPLAKPEYYAKLYKLLQKVSNESQKNQIKSVLHKSIQGMNSRKLTQFRREVAFLLPQIREETIFEPSYAPKSEVTQEAREIAIEDRHAKIIEFIDADLALLDQLENKQADVESVMKNMKSKTAASILRITDYDQPQMDLPDRIQLAKNKLQEAKKLQQTWKI